MIFVEIKSAPCYPAPRISKFDIFQIDFSKILVYKSFSWLISISSLEFIYFNASKGLIDILLIDLHMFSRGWRAFFYMEYMNIMVEKMRRRVIKQLLMIFIIELSWETSLLLKMTVPSLIFSTEITSVSM